MSEAETMKKKSRSKETNIYDLLKQDHKDVKKLFKQIIDEQRYQDNVYSQIKKALTVHMAGEEKLFYPKLENNSETRQMILESYEEHDLGKQLINDIDMTRSSEDDRKLAKVKVLSDIIDHHVEEEEGQLFKKAKKVLSSDEVHEIGRLFEKEKMSSM